MQKTTVQPQQKQHTKDHMKHIAHDAQYEIPILIFLNISARQHGHSALIEGSSNPNLLTAGDSEEYWSIRYGASPIGLLVEMSVKCV